MELDRDHPSLIWYSKSFADPVILTGTPVYAFWRFLYDFCIPGKSWLNRTWWPHCQNNVSIDELWGLFVETYHFTSIVFARIDRGWLRCTDARSGQKESGVDKGFGIFPCFLLPICHKFIFDDEAILDLYFRNPHQCLCTFMILR